VALVDSALPGDPFELFDEWFKLAAVAGSPQPDAMTLATVNTRGEPTARMVLFKGLERGSFVFYTNYESRKGRDLAENRRAALVFYWAQVRHQVRVSGTVRKVSRAESAQYFHGRPRGAQLSALASRQSRVIRSREVLEQAVVKLAARYPDEVPLPDDWGGYALTPRLIEFWESREDRLHDRIRYVRRPSGVWRRERLSP
jgi:pyridoxamine 5'-phosphate oxidase